MPAGRWGGGWDEGRFQKSDRHEYSRYESIPTCPATAFYCKGFKLHLIIHLIALVPEPPWNSISVEIEN